MGQSMVGRVAIRAKQIRPGDAFAARVPAGGLVEIVDLEGRQVAELVAFNGKDPGERMSLGVTRQQSRSLVFQLGMSLYSSRGNAMLELVEDTVGRHDILSSPAALEVAADEARSSPEDTVDPDTGDPIEEGAAENNVASSPDAVSNPDTADSVEGTEQASVPSNDTDAGIPASFGYAAVLREHGVDGADAPDPINVFMNVGIMQKGDLEVREPTSERGDRVVLRAAMDLVVAVRCSDANDVTNGENPTDILVRVYR